MCANGKEVVMKILVTGGTGHLGSALIPRLMEQGHQLRVLARRPSAAPGVEWIAGDLATGAGVSEAVSRTDVVIHAATLSPAAQRGKFRVGDFLHSPTSVDVEGTRRLLDLAAHNGVSHFVYVSIVGLEFMKRLPYARVKLAAEDAVQDSRVPWSIVRATSFYWLLHRLCSNMVRAPLLMLPSDLRMQPVDSTDFASWVANCATDARRGRRADYAGPQEMSVREIVQQYLDTVGRRRRVWRIPLPRSVRSAIERGQTAKDAQLGTTTWKAWLAAHEPRCAA
jgi:uncharacterized protein YbjT (DUF2867 family)